MTDIDHLYDALRSSWDHETCVAGTFWTSDVPASGQCAVTALIVQDHLGGHLLRVNNPSGMMEERLVGHYFNRLPNGLELDFTRGQFWLWEPDEPIVRDRDYVLADPSTRARYQLLKERVDRRLGGSATLVVVR